MEQNGTTSRQPADEPIDVDGHESEEDKPMVDPVSGEKILRPRNAWILYRKTRLNDVAPLPDGSRQPMARASAIISSWWKNESKDVRKKFEMMAAEEKAEHKRRYPDYKYKPRTSQQIAKDREKKRTAKKMQQVKKDKEKAELKAKAKQPSPPPVATSVQTSYVAAALANQTVVQTNQHGPEGPSPPLSLASTPITTPSPLPLSDFEQGSSSTSATSSQAMSSPVESGLGLALAPNMFNFHDQAAPLRAPRHIPARIAPRPRGNRQVSGASTSTTSRVTSASTLVPPSPAVSTSSALSPLAWPLPSSASHHPSPLPQDDTPPPEADLSAESAASPPPVTWLGDPSDTNDLRRSESVSIELDIGLSNHDIFGDLGYFNSVGLPGLDTEGVFQMPVDAFIDAVPGQIDISLPNADVSQDERDRFAALLNDFDFSAFQVDNDMGLPQEVPNDISASLDPSVWQNWGSTQSVEMIPSTPAMESVQSNNLFTDAQPQQPTPPDVPQPSPQHVEQQSSVQTYMSQEPVSYMVEVAENQQPVEPQPQVQMGMPMVSPELLADPDFQEMWARYVAQKMEKSQQQQQQEAQQQQQQQVQQHEQQQHQQYASSIQQPQPLYPQQPLQQHQQQHYQAQEMSPVEYSYVQAAPQQMQYDNSGHVQQQQHQQVQQMHSGQVNGASSGPSTPASAAPATTSRYVPPVGAMYARMRRVAGSWKPPVVQQEAWSTPSTPSEYSNNSRLPSWTGVPST